MKRGKKYRGVLESFDKDKIYTLDEALELLPKLSTSKFAGSAEAHIRLGLDPKQADQNIRGTVALPNGTGKSVKAVVVTEQNPKDFTSAGALKAGGDALIKEIDEGYLDFDVIVAESAMMPKLAKLAKVLGPKGLMPSPKAGTVSTDPMKALKAVLAGQVEYKVDVYGISHVIFGKVDFGKQKLLENFNILFEAIKQAKPNSVKGKYVLSLTLAPSMGPGVKVDTTQLG